MKSKPRFFPQTEPKPTDLGQCETATTLMTTNKFFLNGQENCSTIKLRLHADESNTLRKYLLLIEDMLFNSTVKNLKVNEYASSFTWHQHR